MVRRASIGRWARIFRGDLLTAGVLGRILLGMADLRFIHDREYVGGEIFFRGWIDADAFEWAKKLRKPGECDDLFCECHERVTS